MFDWSSSASVLALSEQRSGARRVDTIDRVKSRRLGTLKAATSTVTNSRRLFALRPKLLIKLEAGVVSIHRTGPGSCMRHRVNPRLSPGRPVVRGSKPSDRRSVHLNSCVDAPRKGEPVDGEDQDRDDQQPAFEDGAPDDRRIAQFHEIEDHQPSLEIGDCQRTGCGGESDDAACTHPTGDARGEYQ